jgi:hypothetical protein
LALLRHFVSADPKVEVRFKSGCDLFVKKIYAAAFPVLIEVA